MAHWTEFLDPAAPDGRYLRWRDVETRVGISRTTAWRLQKTGEFPRPYVISAGRVGYRESELEAWTASRPHRDELIAAQPRGCALAKAAKRAFEGGRGLRRPSARSPAPTDSERAPRPEGRLSRRLRTQAAANDQTTFDF